MANDDIGCSKQTYVLFELVRLHQRHREPNESFNTFMDKQCVIIHKFKFSNNFKKSVLRNRINFAVQVTVDVEVSHAIKMRRYLEKQTLYLHVYHLKSEFV